MHKLSVLESSKFCIWPTASSWYFHRSSSLEGLQTGSQLRRLVGATGSILPLPQLMLWTCRIRAQGRADRGLSHCPRVTLRFTGSHGAVSLTAPLSLPVNFSAHGVAGTDPCLDPVCHRGFQNGGFIILYFFL